MSSSEEIPTLEQPQAVDQAEAFGACTVQPLPSPFDALQQHFDHQLSSMQEVQDDMQQHFSNTLPDSLNPVMLLARLQAISAQLPALFQRAQQQAEARRSVLESAAELARENEQLMKEMETMLENMNKNEADAEPEVEPTPASAAPTSTAPSRKSTRKSIRPQSAAAPSSPSAVPSAASNTGRRKSLAARKSMASNVSDRDSSKENAQPSDDSESTVESGPLSEKEFQGVSVTVRARAKLVDVNHILSVIQNHFMRLAPASSGHSTKNSKHHHSHSHVDWSSMPALTLQRLAEEVGSSKIAGQSGQAVIATLRATKRIKMDKNGITLLQAPPSMTSTNTSNNAAPLTAR